MHLFHMIVKNDCGNTAGNKAYLTIVAMGMKTNTNAWIEGDTENLIVTVNIGGTMSYANAPPASGVYAL